MRSFAGCLALVFTIATVSAAAASPAPHGKTKTHRSTKQRPAKRHAHVDRAVEDRADDDKPAGEVAVTVEAPASAPVDRDAIEVDDDQVVIVKPLHHASRDPSDWHVAIGPDAWVPAFVSIKLPGGGSVGGGGGGGTGSFQVQPNVRFALPLVGELRYRRLSLTVDLLYGAVGVDGGGAEDGVMVTLDGAASYLQLDSVLGYRVVGDNRSPFALDLRGGLRYQRTVVDGAVGASGNNNIVSVGLVEAKPEAVVGARAFVRPWHRLALAADADVGVYGANTTWSAAAAANISIGSHVLLSLGARAMRTNILGVDLVMYGPRAMVEATF